MFRTKIPQLVFLCGLALWLASCAHRYPAFAPAASPKPDAAILYGRFSIVREPVFNNQLALWLYNLDTQRSLYLYFDEQQPVYAIQVKAGHYGIVGLTGVNRIGQVEGRRGFLANGKSTPLSAPFVAAANSGIYLGDFTGHATFDGGTFEWKIDGVTNNFAATTLEFREKYPTLQSVPVTSLLGRPQAGSHPESGR